MLQNCPKCDSEVEPHGMDIDWQPSFYDPDSGSTGRPYYIHCNCGFEFKSDIYDWEEFEKEWNSLKRE